jgi:hypothetical protein
MPLAPAPPVVFVSVVSTSVGLAGYSAASFDAAAQLGFTRGLAATLTVPDAYVAVTGVADAPAAARRRRLAQTDSISVGVAISTDSTALEAALSGSLSALAADPSALGAALLAAGLANAVVLSLAPPTVTRLAPPPPPSPPSADAVAAGELAAAIGSLLSGNGTVNVTAAAAGIVGAFASLSADDASAMQGDLLRDLAGMDLGAGGDGDAAASLVLAVVSAAPGVTLSVASQTAALSVLQSIASGPINVTGGAAQSITGALSAVASAGMGNNPAALAAVASVLGNLAASQASSLVASLAALPPGARPPPPATTSSDTIQTLVQIDPPGSNRLTTQNLTAPGSASSFEPMPAGLLPSAAPVVTQFFSLAFDPNGGNGTTGVTRLAFTNPDGSPIPVENASVPIRFSLPRVDTGGDEFQATCAFWDTAAGAYATHGCVGVPNPTPPQHAVFFKAGFTALNDTALALAWDMSGPMLTDGNCSVMLLDCNEPSPSTVYPDPRNPLLVPAVACPPRVNGTNATQPVLRVYFGTKCALWRADNAYNCSWDNVKQAFVGGACVSDPGPTQCMCRHVRACACACRHAAPRQLTRDPACRRPRTSRLRGRPKSPPAASQT